VHIADTEHEEKVVRGIAVLAVVLGWLVAAAFVATAWSLHNDVESSTGQAIAAMGQGRYGLREAREWRQDKIGASDMALVLGGVLVVGSLIGTVMLCRLDWKKP
jgi:hypothetical protein